MINQKICKGLVLATLLIGGHVYAQSDYENKSVLVKPHPVEQSSDWKPHIALLIGAAQPERSGVTSSEFGIDVGYQSYIPYSLSAELNHARIDDGVDTQDRTTVWGKAAYNFGGTLPVIRYSYAGAGVGAVLKSDGTSVAVAPIIGFDIPVIENLETGFVSLGASSRYAVVSDGDVDTFSLSGVVKYWY